MSSTKAVSRISAYSLPRERLLASILWTHTGLVAFAWNAADRLVCVCDDGAVYVYSVTGEQVESVRVAVAVSY